MKSPVFLDTASNSWAYTLGKYTHKGFKTGEECARKYAEELIRTQPKYKALLHGKTWGDVKRILGIEI